MPNDRQEYDWVQKMNYYLVLFLLDMKCIGKVAKGCLILLFINKKTCWFPKL